ncbi:peptide-N4-(N-acetyl-beta-glucosaminyl)asparagine amidase A [Purpureocillium lavendulum]|uniref:Peptide-N4-(N-acetyl-beta-glucosaminyl)asparagine amidase A n=1 Tax=Purpureocillium lavendulum TaxID=1247861 RepID=A0AB34FNT6_9HYPO|nr:peptide-N4-(N-acetyl-beta-glucosaminyl)asparagine amidase A [Purpureocillium lavendulum]
MVRVQWLLVAAAYTARSTATNAVVFRDAVARAEDSYNNDRQAHNSPAGRAEPSSTKPLRCFQVTSPMLVPRVGFMVDAEPLDPPPPEYKPTSLNMTLMKHSFGNSYGQPFVHDYEPPEGFDFDRVLLNLTVVSKGRQYDRLAIMWLGDIEVWRTSTAEPKPDPGIAWTYWKDMTHYLSLWKKSQRLIFDLGNLVNDKYTGSFNATLVATFIQERTTRVGPKDPPADLIIPISARRGDGSAGSAFTYPDEKAENQISFPSNIRRAVVSIAANGQADEEFWWSNVPDEGTNTFPDAPLLGLSSFREVRLRIDDQLAGLSWPFPVVFTGGVSPPLHRPIVGPEAFDIREQEVDITPWLGLLCDGNSHNFSMEVVGEDDRVVPRYWVLSAKIFIWLTEKDQATKGCRPKVQLSGPDYVPGADSKENEYLSYNQTAGRVLTVKSRIKRGTDHHSYVSWTQAFNMTNRGSVTKGGDAQDVWAHYHGEDKATEDGVEAYTSLYDYSLQLSYLASSDKGYSLVLDANLTQGEDRAIRGRTVFPTGLESFLWVLGTDNKLGVSQKTTRKGRGIFLQKTGGTNSTGFGTTDETYEMGGWPNAHESDGPWQHAPDPVLYSREIQVVNETTTLDLQVIWNGTNHNVFKAPSEVPVVAAGSGFAPLMAKGQGAGSKMFHKDSHGSIAGGERSSAHVELFTGLTRQRTRGEF